MGLKDTLGYLLSSYDQGLTKVGNTWEQYLDEQANKLQQNKVAREQAQKEQQLEQLQQLQLAKEVQALRQQIKNDEADIEQRRIQLDRQRDELERSKATFKMQLDQQRQQIDLHREHFDYEQERSNKSLDNEFTLKMAEAQLRMQQQEHNHAYNMGKLAIEQEQARYQNEASQQVHRHTEKMQQLERDAKQFERDLAAIRLLDATVQQQAYADLLKNMQKRMDSISAAGNNDLLASY
jgi:hypothetical protein